jgi:hypothetical protein
VEWEHWKIMFNTPWEKGTPGNSRQGVKMGQGRVGGACRAKAKGHRGIIKKI